MGATCPLASVLLLLALLASIPSSSHAELFPLNDVSYPHLFITDPASMPVIWHKKSVAFMLAHSAGVRINARWGFVECVFMMVGV